MGHKTFHHKHPGSLERRLDSPTPGFLGSGHPSRAPVTVCCQASEPLVLRAPGWAVGQGRRPLRTVACSVCG